MRFPWASRTDINTAIQEAATKAAESAVERMQIVSQPINNPLTSQASPQHSGWPFGLDNPYQFFITTNPRKPPTRNFSADQLRSWAKNLDPLRAIIEYLKTEVSSVPIKFQPRDPDAQLDDMVAQAMAWVGDTGPLGGNQTRRVFEAKVLEDLLVLGSYSVWYRHSYSKKVLECRAIDAATIIPRVDTLGWPVEDYPFEQWVQGVQIARFTPEEIRIDGLIPQTDKPYFESLVEMAVRLVLAILNVDAWNSAWLTDGTARSGDIFTLPESWSIEQIQQFTTMFNMAKIAHSERQQTAFFPAGAQKLSDHTRKDQDFEAFELQMITRMCSLFQVQPASVGYVGEQYKTSQDGAMKASRRTGVGRLLMVRKEFYDDLLMRLGFGALECVDVDDDIDTQIKRATLLSTACGGAYMTKNEARKEAGLPPIDGGDDLEGPGNEPEPDGDEEQEENEKPVKKLARTAREEHRLGMTRDFPD